MSPGVLTSLPGIVWNKNNGPRVVVTAHNRLYSEGIRIERRPWSDSSELSSWCVLSPHSMSLASCLAWRRTYELQTLSVASCGRSDYTRSSRSVLQTARCQYSSKPMSLNAVYREHFVGLRKIDAVACQCSKHTDTSHGKPFVLLVHILSVLPFKRLVTLEQRWYTAITFEVRPL
jgi:hypothetical protein